MSKNRPARLSSELTRAISEIINGKLKNPLITEMVSVTKVEVSKDTSHAKVFISVFSTDEEKKNRTYSEILKESKTIRYELAHAVRLRAVPELQFVKDESMAYGDKMDKLLKSVAPQKEGEET